jgi:ribosome-associated toxin RatA of RatAB toxin-antitoxin module
LWRENASDIQPPSRKFQRAVIASFSSSSGVELFDTKIRRHGATVALILLATHAGITQGAENMSVEAFHEGAAVQIVARATITAPYALIWQTLTDYDHLSEFIPGMEKSHVIARRDGVATVEQVGNAGVLFFKYAIDVVVESIEDPPSNIGIRVIKGNLKRLDGGYRIEKAGDKDNNFILHWSGFIEPSIPLPHFITAPLMRANISDQFHGMVAEIERRAALRAGN